MLPDLTDCALDALEDLGFFGMPTCDGMDADPPNDPCERALKQLAALLLNVCSDRLQTGCEFDVSAQGCGVAAVGDLIEEIGELILNGFCTQAAECAAAVNEGGSGGSSPGPEGPQDPLSLTGVETLNEFGRRR